MYEQFKARAENVSAEVYRCETKAEALDHLRSILKKEGIADESGKRALWAEVSFLSDAERDAFRSIAGVEFEVTRERAGAARFGINQMEWAIADTGSLAHNSTAIGQRLVSSLPSIHIAFVPTRGILQDMPTLLSKIHPKECAYLAMITGPSRTADIERVLTIGVHGPERLVIIFVDELEGGNNGN